MVEPNNVLSSINKEMKKTIPSNKIQPVPTLSLNSFKTRPMAPVTSRNMSNAASMIKKTQYQARNPNFKRLTGGKGDTDPTVLGKNVPLGERSSPLLAKTMESVASLHPIVESNSVNSKASNI